MNHLHSDPCYAGLAAEIDELTTRRAAIEPRLMRALDSATTGDRNPTLASQLSREQADLATAIEVKRKVLRGIQGRLSAEECESRKPEYRAIIQRMCDAIAALGQASREEAAFRKSVTDAGYIMSLRVMALHDKIDPNDATSLPSYFVREAKQFGLV